MFASNRIRISPGRFLATERLEVEEEIDHDLSIYIDPGNAPQEAIQRVLSSLVDLNIAFGGTGIIFEEDGSFSLENEEAVQ